jgi:tetratricopeptide (TPR) repeat protein
MLLLALLLGSAARAQEAPRTLAEANARLEEAHAAYDKGEFARALAIYEGVASAGFATPAVWSNAGAAAYRNGDKGRAMLYYRRAVRLDPSYGQAHQSMRAFSPKTNDAERPLLLAAADALFRVTAPGLWAIAASVALALASLHLFFAIRTLDPERRGHSMVLMAYCATAALLFAAITAWNHHWRRGADEAVVMANDVKAHSAPDPASEALLLLPAGTVVTLLDAPVRGFVRVRLADGTSVYVETDDIERV